MPKVLVKTTSIYFGLCLVILIGHAASKERCSYRKTVDLTGLTQYDNGSYLYHDIIIPKERTAVYNYRLSFRDAKEEVEPHVRGCVCNNPRYCIKLCCEAGEYYNEESKECEPIPSDFEMPVRINISSEENDITEVNIFDYFVYQVGLPCDFPETLSMDVDRWELLDDGILYIYNDEAHLDTVSYCLTPYQDPLTNEFVLSPMSCPMKEDFSWTMTLNTYAMAISVVFLVPTVLVYLFLKDLRGNMRGKLLICYLTSLIICYTIISVINISEIIFAFTMCSFLGFTCYYFFMAAFLWLSVLCYDIWINFKEHSVEFSARKNFIRFIYYSIYAWGTAAILTLLCIWAQWSELVPDQYKPGIGTEVCWLNTNKWAAAIYFYWPNFIILVFNMITFGHLTMRIYRVRRDLARMTQKERFFQEKWKEIEQLSMDPILPSPSSLSSFSSSALVILRLFLIMGISWVMDILSYCLRNYPDYEFLFVLTDFCNAIQGVLIFVLFVFKRNVLNAIKKRFSTETARKPRRSVTSLSTQFSKLSTYSTSHANTS